MVIISIDDTGLRCKGLAVLGAVVIDIELKVWWKGRDIKGVIQGITMFFLFVFGVVDEGVARVSEEKEASFFKGT